MDKLQKLNGIIANIMWQSEGWGAWEAQVAFLRSPEGVAYGKDLTDRLNTLKATSGGGRPSSKDTI